MNEIREAFFDNAIRAEVVLHLGTQCWDNSAWPEAAKEAFEYDQESVWKAIGIEPPADGEEETWAIEEHLRNHKIFGFLVKFATPIPDDIALNSYSFSWGYYTTEWIYADTYKAACEKAVTWQAEYLAQLRAAAVASPPPAQELAGPASTE